VILRLSNTLSPVSNPTPTSDEPTLDGLLQLNDSSIHTGRLIRLDLVLGLMRMWNRIDSSVKTTTVAGYSQVRKQENNNSSGVSSCGFEEYVCGIEGFETPGGGFVCLKVGGCRSGRGKGTIRDRDRFLGRAG